MDDDTNDRENEDDGGYLPAHVLERLEDPPEEKKSFRRKYEEPLDYSPPSGSTDPEYAAQDVDVAYYTGRHAYTENATFAKEPIPSTWSNSWRDQLNELNRGFYADEETDIKTEQRKHDQYNDAIAWGKKIGLTTTECKRAAYLTSTVDGTDYGVLTDDALILGALTIAANEPIVIRRVLRQTASEIEDVNKELIDDYVELRQSLGVSIDEVRKARTAIRENM